MDDTKQYNTFNPPLYACPECGKSGPKWTRYDPKTQKLWCSYCEWKNSPIHWFSILIGILTILVTVLIFGMVLNFIDFNELLTVRD